MKVIDAIKTRRSIRKFKQIKISDEILIELIDCARLAPYPANIQPLKFVTVNKNTEMLDEIFDCTKWAGYLKDGAPQKNERPMAYIVILGDKCIKSNGKFDCETGIAGSHIVLGTMEYGIGSCWIGSLNREKIAEILGLPDHLEIQDIIALGFPMQKSIPVKTNGDVKYYLTSDGILNVPKRSLEEIIFKIEK